MLISFLFDTVVLIAGLSTRYKCYLAIAESIACASMADSKVLINFAKVNQIPLGYGPTC